METLITHCAGMDVHQETIVVCTLVGEPGDSDLQTEIKTFGTTTRQLFDLLTWLESKQITQHCNGKHGDLLATGLQYLGGILRYDAR